jgi:hypothetical protein
MRTPFDSIESAHHYIGLLRDQVVEVEGTIREEIAAATGGRRVDALRLVDYKLQQLGHHLTVSSRLLNDLRALRKLMVGDD